MPDLNDADLYNIGLAFYSTLNNEMLYATDVMDSETEETYYSACDKKKNFTEIMKSVASKCSPEYSVVMGLKESDFDNAEDFFEAKDEAEQRVITKLKEEIAKIVV